MPRSFLGAGVEEKPWEVMELADAWDLVMGLLLLGKDLELEVDEEKWMNSEAPP